MRYHWRATSSEDVSDGAYEDFSAVGNVLLEEGVAVAVAADDGDVLPAEEEDGLAIEVGERLSDEERLVGELVVVAELSDGVVEDVGLCVVISLVMVLASTLYARSADARQMLVIHKRM